MPKQEMLRAREKAGARYAAAVAELHAALIDLAALEGAIPGVRGPETSFYTFGAWQPETLPDLRHRAFVPELPRIRPEVATRRAELLVTA